MAKPSKKAATAADYIVPLNINGLQGRMLRMPAPKNKNREILFVYGHHSSLERWWGLAQAMNKYGAVTMPDLPGFGGMESFYKLGQKATIDNLADYLAAFIKLRYKRKKITIIGMSFGFVVATRMLQRCPDLVNKVDILISAAGFVHHDDFSFSSKRRHMYLLGSRLFSHRLPALFFRYVVLQPVMLRLVYGRTHNAKQKFVGLDPETHKRMMDFEIHLWHTNDVRTHFKTGVEFLTLDNCRQQVALPVWHISVKADQYFDNYRVEQHMKIVFSKYTEAQADTEAHAPSIMAEASEAEPLLPRKIRNLLNKP